MRVSDVKPKVATALSSRATEEMGNTISFL